MLSGPRLAGPERPVRVGIEEEVEQVPNRQRDAAATHDAMPRLDAGEVAVDERCRLARHLDAVGGCVDGRVVGGCVDSGVGRLCETYPARCLIKCSPFSEKTYLSVKPPL